MKLQEQIRKLVVRILFALVLVLSAPPAFSQDAKYFRGFEGKIPEAGGKSDRSLPRSFFLTVDEDVEVDPILGNQLQTRLSEDSGDERVFCERRIALDSVARISTCGGWGLEFSKARELLQEKKVKAGWFDPNGNFLGWIDFELIYTQHGVHEDGRDD